MCKKTKKYFVKNLSIGKNIQKTLLLEKEEIYCMRSGKRPKICGREEYTL